MSRKCSMLLPSPRDWIAQFSTLFAMTKSFLCTVVLALLLAGCGRLDVGIGPLTAGRDSGARSDISQR